MATTRRAFLGQAGVIGASALAARRWASAQAPPSRKVNLLVLHTDEHNFRTLGCCRALLRPEHAFVWGPGVAVETPHIDWLARHGGLCDRFYASSPVCTPSRASFVSGRFPQNTGAPINDMPMRGDVVTFAEALRRKGYATGYAGKWHLDGGAKPGWSPARQFGFQDNRYMFNRGHWKQLEDTPRGPRVKTQAAKGRPTYDIHGADRQSFTTDFLADKTIAFLRAHKDTPFCFMVSFPDPHGPNTVRPPYDTMFGHLKFQSPSSAPAGRGHMENMSHYFGMVKCVDDCVGRILGALREEGLMDNTIVVFTSDHGDMCGEHGRVNKGVPFEASARIPFVIHAPGLIPPGTVIHQALATVDFKPTILGLMGQSGDKLDEGRDASALLREGKAPAGWKDVAFSRHAGGHWLMAVSSRCKLVVSTEADPSLFGLDDDPLEMRNLFRSLEHRETIRMLGRELLQYAQASRDPLGSVECLHADLAWAADGTGDYVPPKREAGDRGGPATSGAASPGS